MLINERIDPKTEDILYTPIFCKPLIDLTKDELILIIKKLSKKIGYGEYALKK